MLPPGRNPPFAQYSGRRAITTASPQCGPFQATCSSYGLARGRSATKSRGARARSRLRWRRPDSRPIGRGRPTARPPGARRCRRDKLATARFGGPSRGRPRLHIAREMGHVMGPFLPHSLADFKCHELTPFLFLRQDGQMFQVDHGADEVSVGSALTGPASRLVERARKSRSTRPLTVC